MSSVKTTTHKLVFRSVDQCLPLCRQKLLLEVVVDKLYGPIKKIWQPPGHVFISTDDGRKLFTFDCKPIHPQQGFGNSSLDIRNSPSKVLDVLLISSSLAVVVENNGRTQWWRYTSSFDWLYVGSMELGSNVNSRVLSVAYLPASEMLIWCEKTEVQTSEISEMTDSSLLYEQSDSSFSIKGKTVVTSDLTAERLREFEVASDTSLIKNCPACDVITLAQNKLFIRTKVEKDQITISLVCDAHMKGFSLFLGQERFDISSSSADTNLDFRSLLLKHLTTVIKTEVHYGDLGFKADDSQLVSLSSHGLMEIFSFKDTNSRISHKVIPISFEDSTVEHPHWFLHNKHIGIIYHQKLCLYSTVDGTCICKWMSDELLDLASVIQSSSPSFLAWIVSSRGLLGLQTADLKVTTTYSSAYDLPDNDLLQTAVLQLTHFHQLKQQGYSKEVLDKLETLKQAWEEGKGTHQSQILDILAPLLDDYWRLDNKSKELLDADNTQEDHEEINKSRFADELSKISNLPKRARESRLLWLSQIYPQEVLHFLCKGITLDCECVVESEMTRWQALLGIEGWDLSRFELVCRLLFLHHPEKLYHFVKCAESVSERTVGVSAFVRKKHCLIFYKSASECLPLADASCNPSVAAVAQGKLILASQGSNSVEQALKHLLQHKQWREAIDLVKQESSSKEKLPCYLYITMSALAKNKRLPDFTAEIFEFMPSWKSFLSFAQLASMQLEIREHQLTASATDLFCHGDVNVPLGAVKPHLVELIKKMTDTSGS